MIEEYLTIEDLAFLGMLLFIIVKGIQRKEGWGWKK